MDERGRWERRCLERAQRGERAALAELYQAFAPRLYREVLLPRLGDRQAAEDALAETFRALLERVDVLELREGGLWPWLATVATNKAHDMFRVKSRTGRALASFEELLAPIRPESSSAEQDLEARAEASRLKQEVERVLGELNPRYKRAIELRFFEERPREGCASALEVTVDNFDVILCRALKSFRKEWARVHGLRGVT